MPALCLVLVGAENTKMNKAAFSLLGQIDSRKYFSAQKKITYFLCVMGSKVLGNSVLSLVDDWI